MDIQRAAESLSLAIRFKTVSHLDYSRTDPASFRAFEDWLTERYPLATARLARERVGDWGLLYSWKGHDPALKPVLLTAHYDVVPVDEVQTWTKDPWGGELADSFVWGRGALDDKLSLVTILEAVEGLLREGFEPERGIVLAFGADEEVGGSRGAAALGTYLSERDYRFEFHLDEGPAIIEGALPFIRKPLALIGVTEKGMLNVELTAKGGAGHAGAPGREQAAVKLAKAIVRLDARPFPRRMTASLAAFLRSAAREASFPLSFLLSKPRLFSGLIAGAMAGNPQAAAMFHSTMAFTMLEGSGKENVLPAEAKATVNVRILPGESMASCFDRIARIVKRTGVEARVKSGDQTNDPLPESRVDTPSWARLAALARGVEPDCAVLPFLFIMGTDTRHYSPVADASYRFLPVRIDGGELARIHAADERISLENIGRAVEFYRQLMAGE